MERLAHDIMMREIKPSLLAENPDYGLYINTFISSFIKRCRNSFSDKCSRVGRDVLRKLQNDERIIGAIKMARRYGIATDGLEFGAACAVLSCVLAEKPDAEAVKALYAANQSVADVLAYDGEYNKGRYQGLDRERDQELIARIELKFEALKAPENDDKLTFQGYNISKIK